jgi:hypothetical protein
VDRFTNWLDRLKGPTWVYYVAAGTVLVAFELLVQWREGAYRQGFLPFHIFLFAGPVIPVAVIHYLKRVAGASVDRFRAASRAGDLTEAKYRLTTLPAGPTFVANLTVTAIFVLSLLLRPPQITQARVVLTPPAVAAIAPYQLLAVWTFSAFLYFLVHELRTVRRLLARETAVDIYRPAPLYAFSPLTARTAAIVVLVSLAWSSGQGSLDVTWLLVSVFVVSLGMAIFVWPLWGAHGLLVAEKKRALDENAARFKAAAADLHRRTDAGNYQRADDMNKTLASLEIERATLARVPTWPWQPETIRGLLAALILPVVIWLIQYGLQRILQ